MEERPRSAEFVGAKGTHEYFTVERYVKLQRDYCGTLGPDDGINCPIAPATEEGASPSSRFPLTQ